MTNPERHPVEVVCDGSAPRSVQSGAIELLQPREVPLGGPRAMNVRRTLPQRSRSLIGAWCFLDHYGPDRVWETGGMNVPLHPHTGLQTVSWLFSGTIEHRDSAGNHAIVRPGELNLMTAGSGISHSERSTADTDVLHGVQLWVALPDAFRFVERDFEHYAPEVRTGDGWSAQVFLGSLMGSDSPVTTYSPLLGAELTIEPGQRVRPDLDPGFEHGILVDTGEVRVADEPVGAGRLAYVPPGTERLELTAVEGPARVLVLGGPPFGEQIVMWWNFVGRSHDEIVEARAQWQREIDHRPNDGWFRLPDGDPDPPLPAPVLPNARIRPRG